MADKKRQRKRRNRSKKHKAAIASKPEPVPATPKRWNRSKKHKAPIASKLEIKVESESAEVTNRKRIVRIVLLTMLFAGALYVQTAWAPFMYDDITYIVENKDFQTPGNLLKLWRTSFTPSHPSGVPCFLYRPLTATTYLVDFAVYGMNPYGFHITNIVLHALATGLFVILVFMLSGMTTAALVSGLLFAAHPVHTESISWIVGRAELLGCTTCFASMIFWTKYRRNGRAKYLVFSLLFYFLGMASKENAAPLPAILIAGDFLGLFAGRGDDERRLSLSGQWVKNLLPYLLFIAIFMSYTAIRISVLGRFGMVTGAQILGGEPFPARWATAIASIGKYAQLLVFPINLRIDYSDFIVYSFLNWRFALGICITIGLVVAMVVTYKRKPEYCIWVAWFLLFVLPVTNLIIQVNVIFAERFLYIVSASICAMAGIFSAKLIESNRYPYVRRYLLSGLILVLVGLSYKTVERNRDWQDTERFWRKAAEQSPKSEKILLNLASCLLRDEKSWKNSKVLDEAENILMKALDFRSESEHMFSSDHLAINFTLAKYLVKRDRKDKALAQFQRLIRLCERLPELGEKILPDALFYSGMILSEKNEINDAIAAYKRAIEERPNWAGAMVNLANTLKKDNRMEEAIRYYRKAINAEPGFAMAYVNLSMILLSLNRKEEALKTIQSCVNIGNESQQIIFAKGYIFEKLGRCEEAQDQYLRILRVTPSHKGAKQALQRLEKCRRHSLD